MANGEKFFRPVELRRVGTAATMIVICGTLIILTVMMLIGHYNPLMHCAPKAVLDGAVIALLIGRAARWRCLALLGVVYGLVLLLQVGVIYLLPVMIVAGLLSAGAGRLVGIVHRGLAVALAAGLYELLAGFGTPMKLYFGTGGKSEPILWGLWFAEWPLRFFGAAIGVWIALKWKKNADESDLPAITSSQQIEFAGRDRESNVTRQKRSSPLLAGSRIVACAIACLLPMRIERPGALAAIALIYLVYALASGVRWRILHALLGLLAGWCTFGLLSFLWHHDSARVVDLYRTLVLRFAPMTLASVTLVTVTRPVDMIRLLRRLRVSAAVILPFSSVARALPHSRRAMRQSIHVLRKEGHWRGPFSVLRRPTTVIRALLIPQFKRWARELAES